MKQIIIKNFDYPDNVYPTKILLNSAFAKMDYHSRKQIENLTIFFSHFSFIY